MEYGAFRSAVEEFLSKNREWVVSTDWAEEKYAEGGREAGGAGAARRQAGEEVQMPVFPEDDMFDLEQEKGAFFEFMTISVTKLFALYQSEGWGAVQVELEERTRYSGRDGRAQNRRHRSEEYEALLSDEGKVLFAELRTVRAALARERKVPPYFIFVNRSLYEMCLQLPMSMDELRKIYGVGEKNSRKYGEAFLRRIREHAAAV